ncbi:MAG: sigma 54-interacting transcriptional regulator [Oscillospiraceae bacterium]
MSVLKCIQTELEHMVEAMCAVTNVDITVVDDRLQRLAGTGPLRANIGGLAPANSAFSRCLETGQQYFIHHPTEDTVCMLCKGRSTCHELAELCIPIKLGDETIGVLGMCAFEDMARRNFIDNFEGFARFESQLSQLISSMLGERHNGVLAAYRALEMSTLLDLLEDGVAILSQEQGLLTVNRSMTQRFGLINSKLPTLSELVGDHMSELLLDRDFLGEFGPIRLSHGEYIIKAQPIAVNGERHGAVLVFSEFGRTYSEAAGRMPSSRSFITFDDIVGESEALQYARRQAIQIAEQNVPIYLFGEDGTGKETFARAIHAASPRGNDIFMVLNCSAFSDLMIEVELFGYEEGAFPGVMQTEKLGLFEICKDGTLYLNEVDNLSPAMQDKLLHALEAKEVMRIGGTTARSVNPRIISASHRDLNGMVTKKSFHADLFYRLNVVPICIPPLRERGGDVLLLARYFLRKYAIAYEKNVTAFSTACERLLMQHSYPGNIRELRNLVEYAVILETTHEISAEHIAHKIEMSQQQVSTLSEQTRAFERTAILRQIARTGDSLEGKKEAAATLGISLTTLYRKLGETPLQA